MRSENLSLPLSVPHNPRSNGYIMTDQTFHTPSFGDEEFDIPPLHGQNPPTTVAIHNNHMQYTPINHSAPQMGMMNPAQDGLTPPGGAPSYQQPLYLQEPHTPISSQADSKQSLLFSNDPIVAEQDYRSGAPAGNYMIQQQPGGQQRLLMMQPAPVMGAPPTPATPAHPHGPIYGRSPQRASPPGATTSDDSDDSVHHAQLPGDAESLLPIHYCSATRQQQASLHQMSVGNPGMKRPSPEPVDNGITRGQLPKKPKIQKKKKKRDPNEPQKPVSAYALFFRDTQAAIKGQNPNASFGEVSKIVASMWDGLDSEHKSVYKQKTEAAKKEYLKALAAYRASLVSKGGEQENQQIYNHTSGSPNSSFGNYYQGQSYNAGHSPQSYVPNSAPQGYSPQGYPPGQSPTGYGPSASPQGYQPAPGQSPQGYQGGQPQSAQPYQANSAQSPQSYPNPSASPQSYNPAQSPQYRAAGAAPQGFPPQQSPQYAGPGHSPQAYRIAQSQSPPMPPPHSMQYHPHSQSLSSPQRPQHEASLHSSMQGLHSQNMQMQQQQALQQQHMQQQLQQQSQQLHQQQTQQTQQQQNQQQQQQSQQTQQSQPQQQSSSQPMSTQLQNSTSQGHNSNDPPGMSQRSTPEGESSTPSCIRQGCTNPAISSSEWEDEYCSNECVVSHCRDAFNSWVASNKSQSQNLSAVK